MAVGAFTVRWEQQLDLALSYITEAERILVREFHPQVTESQKRWRELKDIYIRRSEILKARKDLNGAIEAALLAVKTAEKQIEIRPSHVGNRESLSSLFWKVANLYREANQWKADDLAIQNGRQSIEVLMKLEKEGKLNELRKKDQETRTRICEDWERERAL